jgi:flagellar protein FlbD
MILVTRINNQPITVNAEMIEFVESTPDTIITMTDGKKIIVKESVKEVMERVIQYKQQCFKFINIKIKQEA